MPSPRILVRRIAPLCCSLLLALAGALAAPAAAQSLLHADHPLVGRIWELATGRWVDEATLRERAMAAGLLLVGETHDNPVHHQRQRELLESRISAGQRPALLMEQFDVERQPALDAALAIPDRAQALDAAIATGRGWDWPQYRPLLAAAHDHRLPVIAANFSRERLRPIVRQGFAAFDAGELRRLEVEAAWSTGRDQYLTGLIEKSHCGKITPELRDGLVKGQRIRDAVMADAALLALVRAGSPAAGVVGIVGRGHARRDIGIPLYLARRAPDTRVLSIGLVEVSPALLTPEAYEAERPAGIAPYDLIWFTPRADRPDPCENFGGR